MKNTRIWIRFYPRWPVEEDSSRAILVANIESRDSHIPKDTNIWMSTHFKQGHYPLVAKFGVQLQKESCLYQFFLAKKIQTSKGTTNYWPRSWGDDAFCSACSFVCLCLFPSSAVWTVWSYKQERVNRQTSGRTDAAKRTISLLRGRLLDQKMIHIWLLDQKNNSHLRKFDI